MANYSWRMSSFDLTMTLMSLQVLRCPKGEFLLTLSSCSWLVSRNTPLIGLPDLKPSFPSLGSCYSSSKWFLNCFAFWLCCRKAWSASCSFGSSIDIDLLSCSYYTFSSAYDDPLLLFPPSIFTFPRGVVLFLKAWLAAVFNSAASNAICDLLSYCWIDSYSSSCLLSSTG